MTASRARMCCRTMICATTHDWTHEGHDKIVRMVGSGWIRGLTNDERVPAHAACTVQRPMKLPKLKVRGGGQPVCKDDLWKLRIERTILVMHVRPKLCCRTVTARLHSTRLRRPLAAPALVCRGLRKGEMFSDHVY